jgi:hypothetical protein
MFVRGPLDAPRSPWFETGPDAITNNTDLATLVVRAGMALLNSLGERVDSLFTRFSLPGA